MATRMAGSDEFKAELDRAASNKAARERIAASPERTAERLSGLDRDSYDFSGFSDKDIVMAMQGSKFGDEDYARLTGNPLKKDEPSKPSPEPKDPMPTIPAPPKEEDPFVPAPKPEEPEVTIPGFPDRPRPGRPERPGVGGGFYVGGDLSQNIGKTGDMNTTIGDGNTFGDGVQIGNDGSVTIGVQSAGNNNSFGSALDALRQGKARAGAFGRGLQFS